MRSIKKFRAWDEDEGHMVYPPFGMAIPENGAAWLFESDQTFGIDGSAIQFMQFTGSKDINGLEIYEGDIMKTSDGAIGEVIYESFSYILLGQNFGSLILPKFHAVIGNVHETPELAPWRER